MVWQHRAKFQVAFAAVSLLALGTPAGAAVPGTTVQLTTGSATAMQTAPAISGTRVVWTEISSSFDIWYLDTAGGSPFNLTRTPNEQEYLEDIDGTTVVFTHSGPTSSGDIVLYDGATGGMATIAPAGGGVHFEQPAISGRYVVYVRAAQYTDIDGYDLALGLPIGPFTRDAAVQVRPRISGSVLVWEDYRDGNADIYGYRVGAGGQPFPIATSARPERYPDVSGERAVWIETTPTGDHLWLADLAGGTRRVLSNVASHKLQPRISGHRVVWADDRAGNLDIYSYDLLTGVEDVLASGPGDQMLSDIDGNRVVFTSNASGFESIFLFTYAEALPDPLPQGCDPALTDVVAGPYVMERNHGIPALIADVFDSPRPGRYFLCVENGRPDGSQRADHLLVTVDGRVVFTPADLNPPHDPPRWAASELFTVAQRAAGGLKLSVSHLIGALLYGPWQDTSSDRVALTIRVLK